MNRASKTYGTMANSLTEGGEKNYFRKYFFSNFQINFYKFDENYKPIATRSSTNYNQDKQKTIPRHITIKLLKASDEEKVLKAARGKNMLYTGGKR